MVVVGRLGFVAFLRGASCGAGRLDHVDVAGASDDLFPWDPVNLLDDLGTLPFDGEPLAVLAALFTLTSKVPVMTFFPGILSVFLGYLYTWY